jgi:NitT/TauT family transport system substrate-binding protein
VAEFAVASPAHLLESGRAGDLVMLLAIQQSSALVYPARRGAGISQLADLRGKRIAVWPGREHLELRWMLHLAGVVEKEITWVPTIDTVSAMIDDAADCAQMTTYHELHQLAEHAGGLGDYIVFAPDHNSRLLKDGLIARRDWVAQHSAETQALVNAALAGWTIAFTQPEEAVRICCLTRPDMTAAAQRTQLAGIRELALCGAALRQGLGFPDPLHLRRAEAALAAVEGVRAAGSSDPRFWEAAPAASRTAAW